MEDYEAMISDLEHRIDDLIKDLSDAETENHILENELEEANNLVSDLENEIRDLEYIETKLDEDMHQLKTENLRLTKWVKDLQSGTFVNCVYPMSKLVATLVQIQHDASVGAQCDPDDAKSWLTVICRDASVALSNLKPV